LMLFHQNSKSHPLDFGTSWRNFIQNPRANPNKIKTFSSYFGEISSKIKGRPHGFFNILVKFHQNSKSHPLDFGTSWRNFIQNPKANPNKIKTFSSYFGEISSKIKGRPHDFSIF